MATECTYKDGNPVTLEKGRYQKKKKKRGGSKD